jgi:hypothetical protein
MSNFKILIPTLVGVLKSWYPPNIDYHIHAGEPAFEHIHVHHVGPRMGTLNQSWLLTNIGIFLSPSIWESWFKIIKLHKDLILPTTTH